MKRLTLTLLSGALFTLLFTSLAQAQATRTWVSGVGDDANPCSRTAPCKTFAGAISKTAAGGLINCIDPGGFGAVTITKSITIDCQNTQAGVLAAGTNGINVSAAATDIVILRGLSIEGVGLGLIGVNATTGSILHIENCRIFGFRSGSAIGINFAPRAGTTGELHVSNSTIHDNGSSATNGGIVVKPVNTGGATVVLKGVQVKNNSGGIRLDSSSATGGAGITASVRDTTSVGNTNDGIAGNAPSIAINVMLERILAANNGGTGVSLSGGAATMRMGGSTVTGNISGVSATVGSYKNNQINGNAGGEPVLPTVVFD